MFSCGLKQDVEYWTFNFECVCSVMSLMHCLCQKLNWLHHVAEVDLLYQSKSTPIRFHIARPNVVFPLNFYFSYFISYFDLIWSLAMGWENFLLFLQIHQIFFSYWVHVIFFRDKKAFSLKCPTLETSVELSCILAKIIHIFTRNQMTASESELW